MKIYSCWHFDIWAFLWCFSISDLVCQKTRWKLKNVKFLKIFNALKWVKMSNFWFLIVKIMFYIREHLYKYPKKHLYHVIICHMTHTDSQRHVVLQPLFFGRTSFIVLVLKGPVVRSRTWSWNKEVLPVTLIRLGGICEMWNFNCEGNLLMTSLKTG